MPRELAIVLCTGSLQSAVTCALAAQKHRIVMLFAETQPSTGRQGQAFDALAQHFKPYRSHRLPMSFLTSGHSRSRDAHEAANVDPRVVEDAAARIAELVPVVAAGLHFGMQYGAGTMYLATRVGGPVGDRDADANAVTADVARWTEFGQLWAEMAQVSCDRPSLEIAIPLLELEPWQVVDLGFQVNAPLGLTWSCEHSAGEPCGGCRGCRERDAAFQRVGRPDPARAPAAAAGGVRAHGG